MENKQEVALALFDSGFNCAQSVLATFAGDLGLDQKTALKLSTGFGGGIARMQKTCGAVTGAIMVLGLKFGRSETDDNDARETTYDLVYYFTSRFIQKHGSLECLQLLGCSFATEEGISCLNSDNSTYEICRRCIADSVEIVDSIINK